MLTNLFNFLVQNKDVITILLTIGGAIWGVWKFLIERWWKNKVRVDLKVFEVISDAGVLLPKLYATENDNSPLADHNIKYHPRDPKHDLQAELKTALNRSRYLLVTAPKGYGKTREAGMLAQTMIHEGWRVLRIQTGWLDTPKELPKELNSNRSRVLIFLDDLNGLFSTGERTQSPRIENDKILTVSQLSYYERLIQMLDFFEGVCTENEIRVIATARSEEEQWKLLNFNEKDKLWKRFERIEIPAPNNSAIIDMLEDLTGKTNKNELEAIAQKNDKTYRNILLNLRRWHAQNKAVSKDDFVDTLDGSWRDVYERAVKKHPAVQYIYDAIDILRQARIDLFPSLVEQTATMLWDGNFAQRIVRQRKIKNALIYLTRNTVILRVTDNKLTPSDGQIEAKSNITLWTTYYKPLMKMLLDETDKIIINSVLGLGSSLHNEKRYEETEIILWQAIKLDKDNNAYAYDLLGSLFEETKRFDKAETVYRIAIEKEPNYPTTYYNLGGLLHRLKRFDETEIILRQAIENTDSIIAYNILGSLLHDQKRFDEAETIYRSAIEKDPNYASAYEGLGVLLYDLKRFDEAEALYRNAIDKDPDCVDAYKNLGVLLYNLKRYDEAETMYRIAVEKEPNSADTYYNLGSLFKVLNRFDEAETMYRVAIDKDPDYAEAYYYLGVLLYNLKRYSEAESMYQFTIDKNPNFVFAYIAKASVNRQLGDSISSDFVEKARKYIPVDDFYNRAYFENACGNFDLAVEYLQKAAKEEGFDPKWVWKNPDWKWVHNDSRFLEIVGEEPE